MESLLCNEVWLQENDDFNHSANLLFSTKEDFEETFCMFLNKESTFSPEPGYLDLLESDVVICNARFKAVNWIIKSQRRMGLCIETVFMSLNYLDRFVSLHGCHGWVCWMFQLLSVACLSVASKFNDTTFRLLYEFQMDQDLENCFAPSLIERMEMTLLKTLVWRINCPTPLPFIDFMIRRIDSLNKLMADDLTQIVANLLLNTLSDHKLMEFQPCVIVTSAIICVLEDDLCKFGNNSSLAYLQTIIPQEHKEHSIKCVKVMKQLIEKKHISLSDGCYWPSNGQSSPVSVLEVEYVIQF